VYTRTIAHLNADGTVASIKVVPVTASEQREEASVRLAARQNKILPSAGEGSGLSVQGVNSDSSCAGSDNWLYDQENFTGNELCLYGSGGYQCAAMSSFPRGSGGNWQFEVYSYWTGNETGYFTDGDINCPGAGWSTYTEYPGGAANCSYGICFSD
jgi:hypothetical protein